MRIFQFFQFSAGTALVFLFGCHSASLKGPDHVWLEDYQQALAKIDKDPVSSCTTFSRLSQESHFTAKDIARIRAWQTCPGADIEKLGRPDLPSWLSDLSLEVAISKVKTTKDKNAQMLLYEEKSTQRLSQREKLMWLDQAYALATELKNSAKAEALLARKYKIAPRFISNPEPDDDLAVANDFRLSRDFNKAREFYQKVLTRDKSQRQRIAAYKGLRLAAKNARQDERLIQESNRLIRYLRAQFKLNPKSKWLLQNLYDAEVYHGRALWTQGQSTQAEKAFASAEKLAKGRLSLAELFWLKARMSEEKKNLEAVESDLVRAEKEPGSSSELRDKILWYKGWNERRLERFQDAINTFSQLAQSTDSTFVRTRSLFWQAKSQKDLHLDEQAKATFSQVIQEDPVGYYGVLAQQHLGVAVSFRKPDPNSDTKSPSENLQAAPYDLNLAETLSAIGERDALASYLDESVKLYLKNSNQSLAGWSSILHEYAKSALFQKLYTTFSLLDEDQRRSLSANYPELLFPQPWLDDVRDASLQFGVAQELIYSIMRQESSFDPLARSPADAFGLMQLIPEVAESLKNTTKISYSRADDLFEPKTNILLGSAHLKELLSRYRGSFILAVASYNASERAVRNWMKQRYRGNTLEFIEEIPYEETRTYVRLVMRNVVFYSLLKSKSASIDFPNWVLELKPPES